MSRKKRIAGGVIALAAITITFLVGLLPKLFLGTVMWV